jgi:hypothetical protein
MMWKHLCYRAHELDIFFSCVCVSVDLRNFSRSTKHPSVGMLEKKKIDV